MILVTGAAGLNGSAIVREFSRNGVAVRALVRDRSKASALAESPGVELVEGDMARAETLDRALEGIDRALMISSPDSQMLETQCRFVDACKAAGVAHLVKFSGKESNVGFDAKKFLFTRMHEEIERHLEGSGLAWTHLRPCQFMQVYLRETPSIAGKGLLQLPLDGVRLSPVDVEDIAKIAFALLTKGGHHRRAFEITGPQALSMGEIAAAIGEAIGKPVRYQETSIEDHRRGMAAAGLPPFLVDALVDEALERLRHPQSRVELGTHELFDVKPTTFVEFARRHA
ncbi:MAG TPA: SDR family oxidoreductase, partial [Vicinamibacterales bacterium]|nr:SDR family oxidoreductase [Vicinamibacterales bacterium]